MQTKQSHQGHDETAKCPVKGVAGNSKYYQAGMFTLHSGSYGTVKTCDLAIIVALVMQFSACLGTYHP